VELEDGPHGQKKNRRGMEGEGKWKGSGREGEGKASVLTAAKSNF